MKMTCLDVSLRPIGSWDCLGGCSVLPGKVHQPLHQLLSCVGLIAGRRDGGAVSSTLVSRLRSLVQCLSTEWVPVKARVMSGLAVSKRQTG